MATQIRGAQIKDAFAGDALQFTGNVLDVITDNTSIEVYGDALRVKASGIVNDMLENNSLTVTAGAALTGGGEVALGSSVNLDVAAGTAISVTGDAVNVKVDGTTVSTAGDQLSVIASGIDHGSISGLDDDDHTHYFLADGTRDVTGVYNAVGMVLTDGDIQLQQAPSTDGDVSGVTTSGTTANVTAVGQGLYMKSDGTWDLGKADADSTMPVEALSTTSSTGVQKVLTYGFIRNDAWDWTPGGLVYASDATAGALTQTIPTANGSQVQIVGVATHADRMFFNPNYILTELGDAPYYTKSELTTSGVLDVRYYTETEVDTLLTTLSGNINGDLESHVNDSTIHFTEASIDHGSIAGLSDDDHPHYSLADGTRAFTGTVSGVTPTEDAHLATKAYVDGETVWDVVNTPYNRIQPVAAHMGLPIYTNGNVTIGGDLTVTGTQFIANVETVQVEDNIMLLNYGETGAGVTSDQSGLQVDRGTEADYFFVFEESTDTFRVGVSGSLQAVATREDSPTDMRVPWWNDAFKRFDTIADTYITVNSGTDTITFGANNVTELEVGTGGIKLKNSTADVNEILNANEADSIGPASTDDQLATAKLIYDYVNTVSGAMDHNELEGLQGGQADEYYHFTSAQHTALTTNLNETVQDIAGPMVSGTQTYITVTYQDSTGDIDFVVNTATDGGTKGVADFTAADFDVTTGTVSLEDSVLKSVSADSGTATPVAHAISVTGSGAVITAANNAEVNISVGYDDSSIGVNGSSQLYVKDEGVTEAMLNVGNTAADGKFLQYTTASGMVWTDVDVAGAVYNTDVLVENESSNCNDVTTVFTLSSTPIDNSVQVFLNGLLQEKGAGKDYTQTGTTITFTTAPLTNDILIIHYIAS